MILSTHCCMKNSTKSRKSSHILGWWIPYTLSMYSNTFFSILVHPLIWGWYIVPNANFIPRLTKNTLQNFDVNLTSLFDNIFLVTPYNMINYFMKIWAISIALLLNLIIIKWVILACPLYNYVIFFLDVHGNLMVNSIEMYSHFHSGMGIGCNSPIGFIHSNFTS